MRTRKVLLILCMACLFTLFGTGAAQAAGGKLTLPVGGRKTLSVKGVSLKKAKWRSSKKTVAAVNSKGVVIGKKAGKAKITAKVGKKSYVWNITVKKLKMSTSKMVLSRGGALRLTVSGLSTAEPVSWSSSKSSVATVNSQGIVIGMGAGTAKIKAKYCSKTYTCKVTVNDTVRISAAAVTLQPGGTYTISLLGASGAVSWGSSNSSVASVDTTGKVKAGKGGVARITAYYGGDSYICTVTVKEPATTTVIKKVTTTTTTVKPVNGTTSREVTTSSGSSIAPGSSGKIEYPAGSMEAKAYRTIMGFKSRYPEGTRFTNADFRSWVGGIYRGGYGCAGFCFELSDACFAPNLAVMRTTNLTKGLRPGDIIRLDYNCHSVIVAEVYKDEVVVAEANYNSSVHWGRHITFEEINRTGTNVITRYEESSEAAIKGLMEIIDTLPVLY